MCAYDEDRCLDTYYPPPLTSDMNPMNSWLTTICILFLAIPAFCLASYVQTRISVGRASQPELVTGSPAAQFDKVLVKANRRRRHGKICGICRDKFLNAVTTPCGHTFCNTCIRSSLAIQDRCPACARLVTTATAAEQFWDDQKKLVVGFEVDCTRIAVGLALCHLGLQLIFTKCPDQVASMMPQVSPMLAVLATVAGFGAIQSRVSGHFAGTLLGSTAPIVNNCIFAAMVLLAPSGPGVIVSVNWVMGFVVGLILVHLAWHQS